MRFIIFTLLTVFVIGCSGNRYPVITNIQDEIVPKSIGPFSAYSLSISSDEVSAELTPMRASTLGESYTVSGDSLFRISPCQDCLKIKSVALDGSGNIALGFILKHPFSKGDDSEPPSYNNRLDLDVFDIALVVIPTGVTPTNFSLTDVHIYDRTILNADGYTPELSEVINDNTVIPYKICCENPENNRFEMGSNEEFEVVFAPGDFLEFDLYLTMGYGSGVKKFQRLEPIYYIPEFNRKAAWKVNITPPTWVANDTVTTQEVMIEVYDWNHGVTVDPNFPDPLHTDYISATSDIVSVTIEVPGMIDTLVEAETTDTETNGWDDPITYIASFANENGLGVGKYVGLVKITDSREPGTIITGFETDTLVHVPDGITNEWYNLSEFATYQCFIARIGNYGWVKTWGEEGADDISRDVTTDESGNIYVVGFYCANGGECFLRKFNSHGIFLWERKWGHVGSSEANHGVSVDNMGGVYVTGFFSNITDFDPGPGEDWHTANGIYDVFLTKFDDLGIFLWAKTWGGGNAGGQDEGQSVVTNEVGNVYVTGTIIGLTDLDPGPGEDWHGLGGGRDAFLSKFNTSGDFIWGKGWGDGGDESGFDVVVDESSNVFVGGYHHNETDFDPGPGEDWHVTNSENHDAFLSKFNTLGEFVWAKTWGGSIYNNDRDVVEGVAVDQEGNAYTSGYFEGECDFDPGPGEDWHTANGSRYAFLNKFNSSGEFVWAKTWAYDDAATCYNIVVNEMYGIYATGITVSYGGEQGRAFLNKFNFDGEFQWTRSWGRPSFSSGACGFGITADLSANIYVSGWFQGIVEFAPQSPHCDVTYDVRTTNPLYREDIFLIKFLPDGCW